MKSKHFGILLFLCLLAPMATSYLMLSHQKVQIKKEVKKKLIDEISKEGLVLLKFTAQQEKDQLDWEHSTEFEYRGEMYDVVTSNVFNDTTYYWCWLDSEETKLNQQLNHMICLMFENDPVKEGFQKKLQNFLKTLYHPQPTTHFNSFPKQSQGKWDSNFAIEQIASFAPPIPPPKVA